MCDECSHMYILFAFTSVDFDTKRIAFSLSKILHLKEEVLFMNKIFYSQLVSQVGLQAPSRQRVVSVFQRPRPLRPVINQVLCHL